MNQNKVRDIQDISYVFCDLDGTLLKNDKSINAEDVWDIETLCKKYNLTFAIATGRALTSVIPLLEKAKLLPLVSYIVANNGVDLYDVKNKVH